MFEAQGCRFTHPDLPDNVVKKLQRNGIYEAKEISLINEIVKPGSIAIDIGAHIGFHTLMMARAVGSEGHIYAFEPNMLSFNYLRKNVRINNGRNISVYNWGISDRKGKAKLYRNKRNRADCRLGFDKRIEADKNMLAGDWIWCELVSIDWFCEMSEIEKVDFIKIDGQAHEMQILRGMAKTLMNNDVSLMIEFWPYGLRTVGSDPRELINYLKSFKFKFFNNSNQEFNPFKTLLTICIS